MDNWNKLSTPARVFLGLTAIGFGGTLFLIQPMSLLNVGANAGATLLWGALFATIIDRAMKEARSGMAWVLAVVLPVIWAVVVVKLSERFLQTYQTELVGEQIYNPFG